MNRQLIITSNGNTIKRLAKVNKSIITYKESGNIYVSLEAVNQTITIKKTGDINLVFTHKKYEKKVLEYTIKMNGQEFIGSSLISTTNIIVTNNLIELEYYRDDDLINIKFELIV